MSKSKGNIIPTDWALENWGADISRFLVASAGDSTLDDGNLDTRVVERLKIELPKLIEEIPVLYKEDSQQKNEIIEKAFLAYYKNKLEVLIDNSLGRFKDVFSAAGHPNCIFKISYSQLIKITNGSEKEISE